MIIAEEDHRIILQYQTSWIQYVEIKEFLFMIYIMGQTLTIVLPSACSISLPWKHGLTVPKPLLLNNCSSSLLLYLQSEYPLPDRHTHAHTHTARETNCHENVTPVGFCGGEEKYKLSSNHSREGTTQINPQTVLGRVQPRLIVCVCVCPAPLKRLYLRNYLRYNNETL